MKKERIYTDLVSEPAPGLWSNAMKVGNILYLSGFTARANDGVTITGKDEYEQAVFIFKKFKAYVEAAGGEMDDIVKMTIFVTNMANNRKVWEARREFFKDDFPACTLVEVSGLANPEILIEIEGIAHIGCNKG